MDGTDGDFFEDDEAVEQFLAAFEHGPVLITAADAVLLQGEPVPLMIVVPGIVIEEDES